MLNQNPTHQDVTNKLRDQWPASIEVGDANKEASGKAVMMGLGAMKDTNERSFFGLLRWDRGSNALILSTKKPVFLIPL